MSAHDATPIAFGANMARSPHNSRSHRHKHKRKRRRSHSNISDGSEPRESLKELMRPLPKEDTGGEKGYPRATDRHRPSRKRSRLDEKESSNDHTSSSRTDGQRRSSRKKRKTSSSPKIRRSPTRTPHSRTIAKASPSKSQKARRLTLLSRSASSSRVFSARELFSSKVNTSKNTPTPAPASPTSSNTVVPIRRHTTGRKRKSSELSSRASQNSAKRRLFSSTQIQKDSCKGQNHDRMAPGDHERNARCLLFDSPEPLSSQDERLLQMIEEQNGAPSAVADNDQHGLLPLLRSSSSTSRRRSPFARTHCRRDVKVVKLKSKSKSSAKPSSSAAGGSLESCCSEVSLPFLSEDAKRQEKRRRISQGGTVCFELSMFVCVCARVRVYVCLI